MAAMISVAPGPSTRSAGATSDSSPSWWRSRGLVSASIAKTTSRSSAPRYRRRRRPSGSGWRSAGGMAPRRVRSAHGGLGRLQRPSGLAAALRVEVLPHHVQVGDLAAEHAFERRAAAEERRGVRLADPGVRRARRPAAGSAARHGCRTGTTAARAVAVERTDLALLPLIERGAADAEQHICSAASSFQASARRQNVRSAAAAEAAECGSTGAGTGLAIALIVKAGRQACRQFTAADEIPQYVRIRTP